MGNDLPDSDDDPARMSAEPAGVFGTPEPLEITGIPGPFDDLGVFGLPAAYPPDAPSVFSAPSLPSAAPGSSVFTPGPGASGNTSGNVSGTEAGAAIVWNLARGVWRFAALNAFIRLGCPSELADGPLSARELAWRCGAHEPSLARVLRSVATEGLIRTVTPGTYELTEAGAVLCTADSPRYVVPFCAEEACWHALAALPETVRTGRSPMVERFGSLYGYLAGDLDAARVFSDFMVARSRSLAARLARQYHFSGIRTLVDVGGGNGAFLAAILGAHEHLRGILLDLENVLPGARDFLADQGLSGRCEFIAGDFFEAVPPGVDAYLVANILHNWQDRDAYRILRAVRTAMPERGRALLVDAMLPDDDSPHFGKDMDVRMLSLFGQGRERGQAEYFSLLKEAGFRVDRVTELLFGISLIEAMPV
jgi:ubiquinone/menaquinone biosynthesis C-methylase UbiE